MGYNIAFYNKSLARGGAERVAVTVSDFLSKSSDNIFIISQEKYTSNEEYECPSGVTRIILGKTDHEYLGIIRELRRVLKSNQIDILIVMGVSNCIFAIPASRFLKTKVIVSERNDPNHFNGKAIVKYASRFFMSKADGYIFQTKSARDFYGYDLNKTAIIYNPVYVDPALVNEKIENKSKEIVNIGRLVSQKNQSCLISAFKFFQEKHKDYTLSIYGDGSLKAKLEEQIESEGLKGTVNLKGNSGTVLIDLKRSSMFILSSDFEGMPNALIEAMVLGLPVVSTDCPVGGPAELVENKTNGLLVPVGDPKAMADAMNFIIENPEQANMMANNAKQIYGRLNIEAIGHQWREFIYMIINQ